MGIKNLLEYLADFICFVNEKTAETIENVIDGNINLLIIGCGE